MIVGVRNHKMVLPNFAERNCRQPHTVIPANQKLNLTLAAASPRSRFAIWFFHLSSLTLSFLAFLSKPLPQMRPSRDSQVRSKPSRKRSLQACLTCRSRKVRCDVSIHGQPCTNCSLDDKYCRLSSGAIFMSVMIPPCSI